MVEIALDTRCEATPPKICNYNKLPLYSGALKFYGATLMSTKKGSFQEQSERFNLQACKVLSGQNPFDSVELSEILTTFSQLEVPEEGANHNPSKTDFGTHRVQREKVTIRIAKAATAIQR
jgi:hypothetical protein